MDIKGHHAETPNDMTAPPMHPHSSISLKQQQQQQQYSASNQQNTEAGATGSSPTSMAKFKIMSAVSTSYGVGACAGNNGLASPSPAATSAGLSYGNNGLTSTRVTVAAGGSYANSVSTTSTVHVGAAGSHGNTNLSLASGSPRDPGGSGKHTASIYTNSAATKTSPTTDLHVPSSMDLKTTRKIVRYRECLKNHAANLGGHANDGCGEFMPSGEEGTIEALTCAACHCHRNFHRREVEGEGYTGNCEFRYGMTERKRMIEPLFPSPLPLPPPPGLRIQPRPGLPSSQMIMTFNTHDSDEYEGGMISPHSSMKKRFRTKFTPEQKEQMGIFAEKLGWRIQKHDEAAVQQFCAEIGVKRHVLKVWMHNNKHALGKKLLTQGSVVMTTEEESAGS